MRWVALAMFVASSAAAQQFSADQIVHHGNGPDTQAKVYVSHPKIRVETPTAVLIVDLEKQRTWTLLPASKKYVEQTGPAALKPMAFFAPKDGKPCDPGAVKAGEACKLLGRETLLGRAADKWETTQTVNGKPAVVRLWIDAKLHYALKWDANPSGGELQNIREGPQAPSLFTLPADYAGLKMPEPH
jgi:outer membrane lipoprotein-sorting protein